MWTSILAFTKATLLRSLIQPLFQGALLQATADLDNAKANLVAAKANLEKAKAMAEQTKADYERTAQLSTDKIMSQQQLDLAKANYDSANAESGGSGRERYASRGAGQPEAAAWQCADNLQLHSDSISD